MPDMFDTMTPKNATSHSPHDEVSTESSSSDEDERSNEDGDQRQIDPNRRPRDESPNSRRVCTLHTLLYYCTNLYIVLSVLFWMCLVFAIAISLTL